MKALSPPEATKPKLSIKTAAPIGNVIWEVVFPHPSAEPVEASPQRFQSAYDYLTLTIYFRTACCAMKPRLSPPPILNVFYFAIT